MAPAQGQAIPAAPRLITHTEIPSGTLGALLAAYGIDPEAITQALLDEEERWLLFETTQDLLADEVLTLPNPLLGEP
jgi:hypothetical protein